MNTPRFVFHADRCTGCEACAVGCWMENRAVQTLPWRKVHTFNPHRRPDLPVFHLSLACHHCAHPACLENCPAGAYRRDPVTGAVIIHADACLGCRYCVQACPYGCRYLHPEKETVDKCTLCYHRITQGLTTACCENCPTGARQLVDFKNPKDPVHEFLRNNKVDVLKPYMATEAKVYYKDLDGSVR